jgi:hypothetical protein
MASRATSGTTVVDGAHPDAALTGLPKGEHAPDPRLTNRNGYRERRWDTRVGTIGLSIPKVRDGSYDGEHGHRRWQCGRGGQTRPGHVSRTEVSGKLPRPRLLRATRFALT